MIPPPELPRPQFPLLGPRITRAQAAELDLSTTGDTLQKVNLADQDAIHAAIWTTIHAAGCSIGFGGYLEHRGIYKASSHFGKGAADRCIHLGIDLWAEAGHPVYAPVDGVIHSLAMNAMPLDYGATIILEHGTPAGSFWTLYGHLSERDLHWHPGDRIPAGTPLCHLGERHENGGWVPHLHFQVILDMGDYRGDFPGVATMAEKEKWASCCPNPMCLIEFAA